MPPPEEESLLHGSLWMVSGQGVAMAAQIVYFILIGRTLGSREYGAFVGVAALIASLSQFSSLGMEMILVRNVSRDRTSFPRTWGHALLFTAAGFLALLAASMLIAHFTLRPELRALVPWIALADGLLGKLVQLAARAFQGAGHLAWTARLTALTYVGRVVTAAGLWIFARAHHLRSTALLWAHLYWIATLAVALLALILATVRLGRPRFARIRRTDVSEGLSFSLEQLHLRLQRHRQDISRQPGSDARCGHLLGGLSCGRCGQRSPLCGLCCCRTAFLSRRSRERSLGSGFCADDASPHAAARGGRDGLAGPRRAAAAHRLWAVVSRLCRRAALALPASGAARSALLVGVGDYRLRFAMEPHGHAVRRRRAEFDTECVTDSALVMAGRGHRQPGDGFGAGRGQLWRSGAACPARSNHGGGCCCRG